MSTIHDVAAAAKVSVGTVSKFINQAGYISPSIRARVEAAVVALNYTPNRAAKQLKTRTSKEIAIIFPNITEKIYRDTFIGINNILYPEYRSLVLLSNDVAVNETKMLLDCDSNNCAGIILCTCQPENSELFAQIHTPLVFVLREPAERLKYSYLGFDDASTIYALTEAFLRLGYSDLALYAGDSNLLGEQHCVQAFRRAFHSFGPEKSGCVQAYPFSREATFRNVMRLFSSEHYPQVFLCTSLLTAQAINEVAHFQNIEIGQDIIIASLAEETWYDSVFDHKTISTFRDMQYLGKRAAVLLKNMLLAKRYEEPQFVLLTDQFPTEKIESTIAHLKNASFPATITKSRDTLRILINEGDAGSDALCCLIPRFCREENVDVTIDKLPHSELYSAVAKGCDYDLISIDSPWIPYLARNEKIMNLTDTRIYANLKEKMQAHIFEKTATYRNQIYGIPYIYTVSLLYYRKDLFNDDRVLSDFYSKHKRQLEPPKNWSEFNVVAKYFTKSLNPSSPTMYGTGIFGNYPTGIMTELFPRIWSYGGSIFDSHGFVTLNSASNLHAIQNLVETIRYANPKCLTYKAFDSLNDFMDNNIAMCTSFSNNANIMLDRARTRIWDNLGFLPIPSRKPVSAGWVLAINSTTQKQAYAEKFIDWIMSPELASSYTILGGASPVKLVYDNNKLIQLYPWLDQVRNEYATSISRNIPDIEGATVPDSIMIDQIISNIIYDHFKNNTPVEILLEQTHKRLCEYVAGFGYPTS